MEVDRELIAAMKENYMSLKASIEERERKAFESGFDYGIDDLDLEECYRAYREKEGT